MILFSPKTLEDCELLLNITYHNSEYEFELNKYKIDNTGNICTPNSTWFLFKPTLTENKSNKYKLSEGDIIKIGRITIKVKEFLLSDPKNEHYFNNNNNKSYLINNIENQNVEINQNNNILYGVNNKTIETLRTEGSQNILPHLLNNEQNEKLENQKIENENNDILLLNKNKENSDDIEKKLSKKNLVCRICYMEEDDPIENPLLKPCICSGSMEFIHYECLRHWINSKCYVKIENNDNCSIYLIKPVECELCKTKLPDIIRHKGKLLPISEFKSPYKNHLILESMTLDKNKNRYIYVINLTQNKKIKIGRGNESNVIFSDISVSRIHCVLSVEGKNVYIEDYDSTFGTLILVQSPKINMVEGLPLYIQIGRTFLICNVKRNNSIFGCCGISEKPNDNYYYKSNEKNIHYHKKIVIQDSNENLINDNKTEKNKEVNKENSENNNNEINEENKDNLDEKNKSLSFVVDNGNDDD